MLSSGRDIEVENYTRYEAGDFNNPFELSAGASHNHNIHYLANSMGEVKTRMPWIEDVLDFNP